MPVQAIHLTLKAARAGVGTESEIHRKREINVMIAQAHSKSLNWQGAGKGAWIELYQWPCTYCMLQAANRNFQENPCPSLWDTDEEESMYKHTHSCLWESASESIVS